MPDLTAEEDAVRQDRLEEDRTVKVFAKTKTTLDGASVVPLSTVRSSVVSDAPDIPQPQFYGVRVQKDYDLDEVFSYVNEIALFKNHWQLKTASAADYMRLLRRNIVLFSKS